MGAPGDSATEEWVTMMDPIQDVDGEWWRPVQEQALQKLLSKLKSLELTTPNEPLTLEQLREMDGEPVWWADAKLWGLVQDGILTMSSGESAHVNEMSGTFYRRPPEGNADA